MGRRNDGVSLEQVRAELDVIAAQIDQQQPGRSTALTIERATDAMATAASRKARRCSGAGAVLMAAFGFDPVDRVRQRRESAARARDVTEPGDRDPRLAWREPRARGAAAGDRKPADLDRGRPARLGGCGLVVSDARRARGARAAASLELPLALAVDLSPDVRVLSFAVALTVATGILFGLAPALQVVQARSACRDEAGLRGQPAAAGAAGGCGRRSSACRWRCAWR